MRDGVGKTVDEVWAADQSDANFAANNFAASLRNLRGREALLAQLHPTTDAQTQALAAAKSASDSLGQSRLQMSFALSAPVCYPLLLTVLGWVVFLFLGYGLMSKGSLTSVFGVLIGAFAIASAFLMILDLSSPYSGIFRASSAPIEQVLAVMGKE